MRKILFTFIFMLSAIAAMAQAKVSVSIKMKVNRIFLIFCNCFYFPPQKYIIICKEKVYSW